MAALIAKFWVGIWLSCISVEDVRSFTIPDRYTLAILAASPFLSDAPILHRILAALLPLLLLPLMGMGDIKLYSALGFGFGLAGLLQLVCLSMLVGGLAAALLLLLRKVNRKDCIPFGPFIAAAAVLLLVHPY